MTPANPSARVLILTPHPLVSALLGMLVGLEQFEVLFPESGERPEDALARLRPLTAIVLDADAEMARSDLFFARAAKRGARVVLFQRPGSATSAEPIARGRGLPWFTLPVDRATLAFALGDETQRVRDGRDRRQPGAVLPTTTERLLEQLARATPVRSGDE